MNKILTDNTKNILIIKQSSKVEKQNNTDTYLTKILPTKSITKNIKETIEKLFPTCESISIDYAVMEKAERIYVLPAEFGWSDLGSWGSLHSLLPKDERNNAVVGENVRLYECNNCIVHTPHLKQAVIQGLDGYIIAEKEGTLLICRLAEEQRIKEFSKA